MHVRGHNNMLAAAADYPLSVLFFCRDGRKSLSEQSLAPTLKKYVYKTERNQKAAKYNTPYLDIHSPCDPVQFNVIRPVRAYALYC